MENKGDVTECPVKGSGNIETCPVKGGANKEECPVKHQPQPQASASSMFGNIFSFFGGSSQTSPPPQPSASPLTSKSAPLSSASSGSGYNTAANDMVFGHQPQPGQKVEMSKKRTISTIPKVTRLTYTYYIFILCLLSWQSHDCDIHLTYILFLQLLFTQSDFTPAHQPGDKENWVYPSQQQYYKAMKRKGYDPAEEDVAVVLKIHNIVNEKGWSQIKEWEALRGW